MEFEENEFFGKRSFAEFIVPESSSIMILKNPINFSVS